MNQKKQREDALKSNHKKYYKSKLPPELTKSEYEKDIALKRAIAKVDEMGMTDETLLKSIKGLRVGGYNLKPWQVMDSDSVWEMMENGVSSDEIIDAIYDTEGKLSLESQYKKNKRKEK